MRFGSSLKAAVVAVLVGAALVGGLAGPAAAQPAIPLTGGVTTATYQPGYLGFLVRNRIAVIPVPPATLGLHGGITESFPVVGGAFDPATLTGTIEQAGGNLYVDLRTGRSVTVTDFVVDPGAAVLTARVKGTATRITLFTFDQSALAVSVNGSTVRVTGLETRLAGPGADLLNRSLGTTAFTAGLDIGPVEVVLTF